MGLLRKLLAETSRNRAEWIIWVDADTIIQARPVARSVCGSSQLPTHLGALDAQQPLLLRCGPVSQ